MKDTVRTYWIEFNEPLEGRVNWMYCDVKGWVSTGVGNLIDATPQEMTLPTDEQRARSHSMATQYEWHDSADNVADESTVGAAWDVVKDRMDLAASGHRAYEGLTDFRISNDEIDRGIFAKVDEMESFLKGRDEFADFDNWPADAQLAVLSMSWGMGPAFRFPRFAAAAAAGDWATASDESKFQPDVGTIVYRNRLDREHLLNAARVVSDGLDPELLTINVAGTIGIQIGLNHLGFPAGPTDGEFGDKTAGAIRAFQEKQGFEVTGDPADIVEPLAAQLGTDGFQVLTN